jgi:hypothetical protein
VPLAAVAYTGLALSLIGILYLGILPSQIIELAQASVGTIF